MRTYITHTVKSHVLNFWMIVGAALLPAFVSGQAAAQVSGLDNPTPLTTGYVKGDLFGRDDEHYYSFTAGPGEIRVTLDVWAAGANAGMTLDLLDEDGQSLIPALLAQGVNRGSERATERLRLASRQTVIIKLKDIRYGSGGGRGLYAVTLNGAVRFAPEVPDDYLPVPAPDAERDGYQRVPQSTDPDRPTVLETTAFSGRLSGGDQSYYYTFIAGPGDVDVIFEAQAFDRNAGAFLDLYDAEGKALLSNLLAQGVDQGRGGVAANVRVSKRTVLTLRVKGIRYGDSGGQGRYDVRLHGAIRTVQTSRPAY